MELKRQCVIGNAFCVIAVRHSNLKVIIRPKIAAYLNWQIGLIIRQEVTAPRNKSNRNLLSSNLKLTV